MMNYYSPALNDGSSIAIFGSVFMGIFFIVFALIAIALPITIGYLIYKDAVKHNIENPMLWAIISGITWIGIILYFVINKRDNK